MLLLYRGRTECSWADASDLKSRVVSGLNLLLTEQLSVTKPSRQEVWSSFQRNLCLESLIGPWLLLSDSPLDLPDSSATRRLLTELEFYMFLGSCASGSCAKFDLTNSKHWMTKRLLSGALVSTSLFLEGHFCSQRLQYPLYLLFPMFCLLKWLRNYNLVFVERVCLQYYAITMRVLENGKWRFRAAVIFQRFSTRVWI